MSRKVALVLSGGGALGAFQFGAIKYIETVIKNKYKNFNYSIISGVSVGALNAVMLAMDKYSELEKIWNNIKYRHVFRGRLNFISMLKTGFGRNYVISNKPLKKLLEQNVTLEEINDDYILNLGFVSLRNGEYISVQKNDFADNENFIKAIIASTTIPVLNKPVSKIKLKNGTVHHDLIDGGMRRVSPVKDIMSFLPDDIIIIDCTPKSLKDDKKVTKNIIKIAQKALTEIIINENISATFEALEIINDLVIQAKDKGIILKKKGLDEPYKIFNYIHIEPDEFLGDMLDFSKNIITKRIERGYELAEKSFENYKY